MAEEGNNSSRIKRPQQYMFLARVNFLFLFTKIIYACKLVDSSCALALLTEKSRVPSSVNKGKIYPPTSFCLFSISYVPGHLAVVICRYLF